MVHNFFLKMHYLNRNPTDPISWARRPLFQWTIFNLIRVPIAVGKAWHEPSLPLNAHFKGLAVEVRFRTGADGLSAVFNYLEIHRVCIFLFNLKNKTTFLF